MTKGRVARGTHGEQGFARNCTCEPCKLARARYRKALDYDRARGVKRRVDAGPVRDHILTLIDGGVTANQVARAAGVHRVQVRRLLGGNPQQDGKPVEWVHRATAVKLLAVTVDAAYEQPAMVPAVGTRRRIEALAARGYTKEEIGAAAGVTGSSVFNWLARDVVTAANARRMVEVFDRLAMGEGSSETMKWKALRNGWAPPLAWDDADIDDPNAEPKRSVMRCAVEQCGRQQKRGALCLAHHTEVRQLGGFESSRKFRAAVMRLSNRKQSHNRGLLLDQLREMREAGLTAEAAAKRLGRSAEYVSKIWGEAS